MIFTFSTGRARHLRHGAAALIGAAAIFALTTSGPAVAATATATDLTPNGVAVDPAGRVYVSDLKNRVVYRVDGGVLQVVAGTPGASGLPTPGPAVASALSNPSSLTVDAQGNLFISDTGTDQAVLKVNTGGTLSVVAGVPGHYSNPPVSGPATSSELRNPAGLAVSGDDLYIADQYHSVVLKVDGAGTLSTFAGRPAILAKPLLGPATSSPLSFPQGVAVDREGNVVIADTLNSVVSKVDASGDLSIIAGNGTTGVPYEGTAKYSPLGLPAGLAFDDDGNLYISDPANHIVLKLSRDGEFSIVAGTGKAGAPKEGPASNSDLDTPSDLAVDAQGNLYVADPANNVVLKINRSGELSVFAGTGQGLPFAPEPEDVTCTGGTLQGIYQTVTVEQGATCRLVGAQIKGDIIADGAEAVIMRDVRVDGSISVRNTASAVALTESTVKGDVTVDRTGGPVNVANNDIRGNLKVTNSTGLEDSALVLANDVRGTTSCQGTGGLAEACNVGAKTAQVITFTSTPPSSAVVSGTYQPTARGGDSGNPVTFSIGGDSDPDACRLDGDGATVSFSGPGTCVVVADQAGDDEFLPAPSAKQTITVTRPSSPPSVTIDAPVDRRVYAQGSQLTSSFSCTEVDGGPGIESCVDGDGKPSGSTLSTATPGTFDLTVTATSKSGRTTTKEVSYTVAGPPKAVIGSPADGGTYTRGQSVTTAFSCQAGAGSAGIESCVDSGGASGGTGTLSTDTVGAKTYTVTAVSKEGQRSTTTLRYTVTAATTTLVAHPQIRLGNRGPAPVGTGRVGATLSSGGAPVAGATIGFSVGRTQLCTAKTSATGLASCSLTLARQALVVLAGGYTATFAGTPTLGSSTAVTGWLVF